MTEATNNVYVRWYGQVVQGTVVNEHDLFGMVAVSLPVQGMSATALFTPAHVYQSVQETCGDNPKASPSPSSMLRCHRNPTCHPSGSSTPEENALRLFVKDHWDHDAGHLRTDCLDEFYHLWRNAHHPSLVRQAAPTPVQQSASPPPPSVQYVAMPSQPSLPLPKPSLPKNPIQLSLFD